jgi:hypothetical protein
MPHHSNLRQEHQHGEAGLANRDFILNPPAADISAKAPENVVIGNKEPEFRLFAANGKSDAYEGVRW